MSATGMGIATSTGPLAIRHTLTAHGGKAASGGMA